MTSQISKYTFQINK